jgi:hypothetical protein
MSPGLLKIVGPNRAPNSAAGDGIAVNCGTSGYPDGSEKVGQLARHEVIRARQWSYIMSQLEQNSPKLQAHR